MAGVLLLVLAVAMIPSLALADCRNGGFVHDSSAIVLAKVVGAPRTYLRGDVDPCPAETSACRGRTYVIPGDVVLLGDADGDYVCALFPGKGGGSAGFVRNSEVAAVQPTRAPVLADWRGVWRDGDNSVTLTIADGALAVKGEAFWPSANPPRDMIQGGPHIGQVGGSARPRGDSFTLESSEDEECKIRAVLLPPFLIVDDNLGCGGVNVSFRGVYRRKQG